MTAVARWTCPKCGAEIFAMQRGNHERFKCPQQGYLKEALRKQQEEAEHKAKIAANPELRFFQYLPCLCACGDFVGQVKGRRKKHYVDDNHYARHRNQQRASMARASVEEDDTEDAEEATPSERRLAEEVAPIAAKVAATQRAAEAVTVLTPEASFDLWMRCLGINAGDGAGVAE